MISGAHKWMVLALVAGVFLGAVVVASQIHLWLTYRQEYPPIAFDYPKSFGQPEIFMDKARGEWEVSFRHSDSGFYINNGFHHIWSEGATLEKYLAHYQADMDAKNEVVDYKIEHIKIGDFPAVKVKWHTFNATVTDIFIYQSTLATSSVIMIQTEESFVDDKTLEKMIQGLHVTPDSFLQHPLLVVPDGMEPSLAASMAITGELVTSTGTDAVSKPTLNVTQPVKVITTVKDILRSQEKMSVALMAKQEGKDREWRFFDLMAPLGVLDPYASESSSQKDGATMMNQLFGYYGSKYGIPESRILELSELPLSYAKQNFNVDDYFKQNKSKLDSINDLVNARKDLNILAYWTSGIGRINETFNAEIGFWKQDTVSGDFIDLSNVSVATTNQEAQKMYDASSVAKLNQQEAVGIVDKMASINMTMVYKCAGKTIYIMGSTADNASGFLRNGTVASDVNCGLLANRFEIVTEKRLDGDWIFWVGR